jgi:RNA polymerase sigma factor (sigma-70 family)
MQAVVRAQRVPAADADDIVSEAMCKVLRQCRNGSSEIQNLCGYASVIARRECGRWRHASRAVAYTDRLDDVYTSVTQPCEPADQAQAEAVMDAFGRRLRSPQRTAVFRLHFQRHLPVPEVAHELGCRVYHVNRQVAAILREARKSAPSWAIDALEDRGVGSAAAALSG